MELKQALQTALDFEKTGHSIYEGAANKTKNPIVEKTFRYLASQELIHIEEIQMYIENLDNGLHVNLKGDKLEDTQQFFNTNVITFKGKTDLSDDDIKAHERGLELEGGAYDFYKEQYQKSDKPEIKKLFEWLMMQENAHYELIRKAYDYIKNPIGFYTEEEKWIADGG